VRSSFRAAHPPGSSPSGSASRLWTVINGIAPENGGIPCLGDQVTIDLSWRDAEKEDMTVDARPKRGIKEDGNQAKFGKQGNGSRLSLAMSPTTLQTRAAL
jgi:hypothetical protein